MFSPFHCVQFTALVVVNYNLKSFEAWNASFLVNNWVHIIIALGSSAFCFGNHFWCRLRLLALSALLPLLIFRYVSVVTLQTVVALPLCCLAYSHRIRYSYLRCVHVWGWGPHYYVYWLTLLVFMFAFADILLPLGLNALRASDLHLWISSERDHWYDPFNLLRYRFAASWACSRYRFAALRLVHS